MSEKKATKKYVNAAGEETRSAHEGATALVFTFANGDVLSVDASKLPQPVQVAAMWHGLAQKIGDAYASAKSAEDAADAATALYERLEAGDWVAEREAAGPRISLILQAIVRTLEKAGKPLDEAGVAARAEKLKTDKAYREQAMANPQVAAEYAAIQAERAAQRAADAAAKAAGGTPTDLSAI
jgi:hypothetical protein